MAKRDGKIPLMRYLTRKLGVRRGYMCMAFIVAWVTARADHEDKHPGEAFGIGTYATWWQVSLSTAHREQRLFREAFAQWETPNELVDEMLRQHVDVPQKLQWSL